MHRVEQPHTPHCAEAGDGGEAVQGLGVVRLSRLPDGPCDSAASLVIAVKQGEVDGHRLVHGRLGKPCGDPGAVRVVGDLLPTLRQVVRPGGLLHVGQECRTLTRQRPAVPEQSTGRPHRLGIDRGLGEQPTAPPHGDCWGIELVVCGVAPRDGVHLEGRPTHTGHACASAEVSQPRPLKRPSTQPTRAVR